jgi:hypothetical protein
MSGSILKTIFFFSGMTVLEVLEIGLIYSIDQVSSVKRESILKVLQVASV